MSRHLDVNPIACAGHGLCAELLPEMIRLDDWGFPIIDDGPIPRALEGHARRAVAVCPTLALLIRQRSSEPAGAPRVSREARG
jgi:ferredoxin